MQKVYHDGQPLRHRLTSHLLSFGAAAILAGTLTGGCLFPSQNYKPVTFYDISLEANPPASYRTRSTNIALSQFQTVGPYGKRMVYRKTEHRLVQDEYNRWIQPPEDLARQAFYNALTDSKMFTTVILGTNTKTDYILTADILRWETTPDLKASLGISVQIMAADTRRIIFNRRYHHTRKLAEATPNAFADAASETLSAIIKDHLQDLDNSLLKKTQP